MIEIQNVTKTYSKNKKKAVDNLSLKVDGGELFGFIGPNGAGKTTTIKLMTGILTPDEGRALLERGKLPGGDQLLAQVNLVPLAQLGDNQQQEEQLRSSLRSWLRIEDTPNAPALLPPA